MISENHVTHTIGDPIIGVGGYVVEELVGRGAGDLGGRILLATKRTEANKELVVNCASIL